MVKNEEEYEKRKLLIESAKKEFMERGYSKASLRNICANAGMTTGALYFFFNNKEDLFDSIVYPPVNELKRLVSEHYKEDLYFMKQMKSPNLGETDHSDLAEVLADHIYNNYDSFLLLLSGAKEGALEMVVDEFVSLTETSYVEVVEASKFYTYDPFMAHWMAHTTIDSIVHIVKHEKDCDKAKKRIQQVMNFLVVGWMQLVLVKK